MSIDALFAVTRLGLGYERARMQAASGRIASADVPLAQAGAAGATRVDFVDAVNTASGTPSTQGAPNARQVPDDVRQVFDPGNPLAGADGMVDYPKVDLAREMTTLMSAERAYQADIRAFNTLHGMLLKSLNIGGNGS